MSRVYAAELLEELGCRVLQAADGWEALEVLRRKECDAVLTDMRLPDMDGVGVLRLLRELPSPAGEVPVIAVTVHADKTVRQRCLEQGMVELLQKPLTGNVLKAALEKAVGIRIAPVTDVEDYPPHETVGGMYRDLPGVRVRLGNMAGGAELCREFLSDLQDKEAGFIQAVGLARVVEAAALVHSLAGGAAVLGLKGLVEAARRLDFVVALGMTDIPPEERDNVLQALSEARRVMRRFLDESGKRIRIPE